jgi:HD-GYP domain-containing protein (c-di-GMP phosphodiesterase class II)
MGKTIFEDNVVAEVYSVVEFRNIKLKSQTSGNHGFKKKSKLSFKKLAAEKANTSSNAHTSAPDENRKALYEQALRYLDGVMRAVRAHSKFRLEDGLQIVREIAASNDQQDPVFIMSLHLNNRQKFILHHGVNVAIYAINIAKYLGFEMAKQVEIGLAGLLHDVGTAAMPEKIIFKQGTLKEEEFSIIKKRPNFSYKILQTLGHDYAHLTECAVQVHERADGSGYPRGIKSNEISESAKIIGLLDVYEALTHFRPYRGKLAPFASIKEIIDTSKDRFEHKYLKALLNMFTVFPLHSYVRLNSDAIGRVIETYSDYPMRPKLRIIYDSQKQRVLTDRIVSLPEDPLLHIVDSVNDEEIRQLSNA